MTVGDRHGTVVLAFAGSLDADGAARLWDGSMRAARERRARPGSSCSISSG